MDNENLKKMMGNVEDRLKKQISDLESVKKEIEEDQQTSVGLEREKNQKLLDATVKLLNELKQAHSNISSQKKS